MKRICMLSALLLVLMGALGWASPQAERPAATFHVQLGIEHALQGVEINRFFPADLTVNAGDTI